MKSPNVLWTTILLIIPAIVLFVTGASQEHLISVAVSDLIIGALAIVSKYAQERQKEVQPVVPAQTPSLNIGTVPSASEESVLYRVFFR